METIPVTVAITTMPHRKELLDRAIASVKAQTVQPEKIEIGMDSERLGSAHNRHNLLQRIETEWVAFLDDDDEFMPHHLETLWNGREDGDLIYAWYEVVGGTDPWETHFNRGYRPGYTTTITVLVRTELAKQVGFLRGEATERPALEAAIERRKNKVGGRKSSGDDHFFSRGIHRAGGKVIHIPERTWKWYHHGKNTGGLPI
jgi:glycosyltransferase involved in cell wall biosynthesis